MGNMTYSGRVRIDSLEALLLTGTNKKLGANDGGPLYLAPFLDSTMAVQIREADDTEVVFNVDTLNGRIGIQNATGATPQYRLDIGNLSYFAINGNFAHIIQHNSAAPTFWSIAPRNNGDLDIAVTTTDPRPTGAVIATGNNAVSIKTNKDVEFLGGLLIGNPTGSFKGAGMINAEAVYDDNVLLTDYVFDEAYTQLSIAEMQRFYENNKHLPTMIDRSEWEKNGKSSLGSLVNQLWETVEVQAKYIAKLNERLQIIEDMLHQ